MSRSLHLRTAVVIAIALLGYAAWLATVVIQYLFMQETGGLDAVTAIDTVMWTAAFLGFPAIGALLAVKLPHNPVGWTILTFGAGLYLLLVPGALTELEAARTGTVEGLVLWAAALLNALSPVLMLVFVHVLLFFPDGELTGRARWLSRTAIAVTSLIVVLRLLRPGKLDLQLVEVANPLGQPSFAGTAGLIGPLTVALVATGLVALGRLIARYRRADRTERKQFQWILASLAAFPPMMLLGNVLEGVTGSRLLGTLLIIGAFDVGFLGFAVALYRAITKQNLYGIDRIVSRTLAYAVVTAVLVSVYLGLVLGLGTIARALTGESGDIVVTLSTLAVAALFQPVRRRVQSIVDRRFNRARYDAARTVDAFGRSLRDEVSLDAITDGLRTTTAGTFLPRHVGVVLVDDRCAAVGS